jgi:hypothetical protein
MRKRMLAILATLSTVAALGTVSAVTVTAPAYAKPVVLTTYTDVCNQVTTSPACIQDPSDGGIGTAVLADTVTQTESFDFASVQDTRCGGTVTSTCPFNASIFNTEFLGKQIVNLKQITSQDCVRLVHATNTAVMGHCDDPSGGTNEPSAAYVFDVRCGGSCNDFVSVGETNNLGTEWVLQTNGQDQQMIGGAQNFIQENLFQDSDS